MEEHQPSEMVARLKPGVYRHFKGGMYEVLGPARHSETEEEMVVYRNQATGLLWVRPIAMFFDTKEQDGQQVPRFQYINPTG